ncbi:MAG TPA: methyltransferase domain-containing protein [Candidatus Angelobacter sp.]|jgi:ubiquinone/menaquinone biosynthesis C-methylase UbiE|nr:methyltransferase domain-containing protein [Candidatus Angelobacter sp.]
METPSSTPNWDNHSRAQASRQWRKQSAMMGQHVTDAIVAAARIEPSMRVLDVACGSGEPAISIATLLNGTGEVIGIDTAQAALQTATERATQRQLTNIRFQLADAHQLPFPDNNFDRITSRLGVMFFNDLARALGEMHRVLKPGGRAVLLAWGPMNQPYFETTIGTVLRAMPGAMVPEFAKNMFVFGQPGVLAQKMADAGFSEVEERFSKEPWNWPGLPADVWEYFQDVAVPFAPLLKSIPPELRPDVDAKVLQAIDQYYDGQEIKFTAKINMTSASK